MLLFIDILNTCRVDSYYSHDHGLILRPRRGSKLSYIARCVCVWREREDKMFESLLKNFIATICQLTALACR